jgi:hypothetical protein
MKSELKIISKINEKDLRRARRLLKQLEADKISAFEKAQRFFIIQESLLKIRQRI